MRSNPTLTAKLNEKGAVLTTHNLLNYQKKDYGIVSATTKDINTDFSSHSSPMDTALKLDRSAVPSNGSSGEVFSKQYISHHEYVVLTPGCA